MTYTKAEVFRLFLLFISNENYARTHIAQHLQFIEFLYSLKIEKQPRLTFNSLLNKIIIIEFFSIIEAILYDMLLKEKNDSDEKEIKIDEYTKASILIKLAKELNVIDNSIADRLYEFGDTRNLIHIIKRRPSISEYEDPFGSDEGKTPYEHIRYSDKILLKREKVFKDFIELILDKHSAEPIGKTVREWMKQYKIETLGKRDFPWPREGFGLDI